MRQREVALLRGINVGGRNKLPMKGLATIFEEAGCTEIKTYIQSGNVVYSVPASKSDQLPRRVESLILRDFGLRVPVVTRTRDQMAEIVENNPFLGPGVDEKELHVSFLADEPEKERVLQLDPNRSPPDRFRVRGREIYLHFPEGVAKSRLTNAYFDSKLATISTARNWRTTCKLLDLAKDEG